jgi:hypothetical protein
MLKESQNGEAKWWLAGNEGAAVAHLGVGEKLVERGKLWPMSPFIGTGEREEATVVPHVGDDRLTAYRSGGDAVRIGFPYLGSLTSGPQSAFQTWREPESVWATLFIGPAR